MSATPFSPFQPLADNLLAQAGQSQADRVRHERLKRFLDEFMDETGG